MPQLDCPPRPFALDVHGQAETLVPWSAERQEAVARACPPVILTELDESCLRRPVGEPDVMRAQLARLIEFAELPNTTFQVAPFDMGEHRPFDLPVTVLTLPNRQLMTYAESAQRGHLDREGVTASLILTAYHQMQADALSQTASVA
ncbi:Scr1 family TA system antitoxin-like transcriptional regulator [Streptomyces sp. NPDC057555]|uniref:Scr1 family TA system antitoxin-like transcriptional regulator n=1 Tax=Streptomyces sp. NPDC057555 TaxID=3346166 RepID=UPI0036B0E425